jgi:hypothetical protein
LLGSETWIVLLAGAVCAIIAVIVARIIADRGAKPEDVTIGFLGPSLAALYLLVLAVALATEWQTIGDAHQASTTEASAVRQLYWSTEGLSPAAATGLQQRVRTYAATVVDHDWPQMRHGTLDEASQEQLASMHSYVLRLNPNTDASTNAQLDALSQLGTLVTTRSQREDDASTRLPIGLLAGVIATSLVVAGFPFVCGISSAPASVGLAAVQAALVGVGIVVVFQLNHAYTGPLEVTSAPMQAVVHQFSAP